MAQFTFLGKTNKSLSFRQKVKPYIINKEEVENYKLLEDKTGIEPVEPIYIDYKDYGVFDTEVVINQEQINDQQLAFTAMTPEEVDAIEKIQPIYQNKKDYTNYFGSLTSFEGEEFEIACENYLNFL